MFQTKSNLGLAAGFVVYPSIMEMVLEVQVVLIESLGGSPAAERSLRLNG